MFYVIKFKTIIIAALIIFILIPVIAFSATAGIDSEGVDVPIIMYHGVLKNQGRLGTYILSPAELEGDLKYLKDKGYTAVFMKDLVDYVYKDKALPAKPVVLTFDDGFYNNYFYVLPLLEQYDMKAVFSIVGILADKEEDAPSRNPNYSYLSWKEMGELIASGRVEIQNHSYNMHTITGKRNGAKKRKSESAEEYERFLYNDIMKLQVLMKEKLDYEPITFTYPFGAVSQESHKIIEKMGFLSTLSCSSGINKITKDPKCLFMLRRYNRPHDKSIRSFIK